MKLYKKNLKKLIKENVYYPNQEHDACGVGFVASTEGIKSRKVVEFGISQHQYDENWYRLFKESKPLWVNL